MDILRTPCVLIIIAHTLYFKYSHVQHHREFEHSHALHTYKQRLCVEEDST